MRMLFSILSITIVVGIAIWWSMKGIYQDMGLVAPGGQQTETPIDKALEAKQLIESHNVTLP